jgi:hypothetical protein
MTARARTRWKVLTATRKRHFFTVATVCLLAGVFVTSALAIVTDISGTPPQSATINGAIYETIVPGDATGSGVFDSFLRTQSGNQSVPAGSERGFNTDAQPTYDAKGGAFTHSILLSAIPTVSRGGVLYREFVTDINQSDSTPLINLNEVELWLTLNANLTGYVQPTGFPSGATKVYELDSGGSDHTIVMNSNVGSGSGKHEQQHHLQQQDRAV